MKKSKTLSLLCLAPLLLTSCSNSSKEEYIEWLESRDSNVVSMSIYCTSYYEAELDKYMIALYVGTGFEEGVFAGTNTIAANFLYAVGPQKSKDEFVIDFTSDNAKYYLNCGSDCNILFQSPNPSASSKQKLDLYSTLPAAAQRLVLDEFFNKYEVTFTKRSFDDSKSYEVNKDARENDFAEQTWTIKCEDITYVTSSRGVICSKSAPKESIFSFRGNKAYYYKDITEDSTFDDINNFINQKLAGYLKSEESDGVTNVWANN